MSRLHICNAFFERELESQAPKSLTQWIRSHPILMQLQFLPLLYADSTDKILVSDLPENPDPRLCLLDHPPQLSIGDQIEDQIEDWGPSQSLVTWAKSHHISYSIPNLETIRTINSKVFSFTHSPQLPGAELLLAQEQTEDWIQKTPGPKVLKTPFGTAGNGHIHNTNVKRLYTYPLIGEPWVERVLDFSTQWKNGKLIGVTVFENEPNGTYKGTFVADIEAWALAEHLSVAKPLIEKIRSMGYLGHVGIDAFIYLWQGEKRLHPIVEINARKTMSWVALQLPQKRLYYTYTNTGLLPSSLKSTQFKRNITYT